MQMEVSISKRFARLSWTWSAKQTNFYLSPLHQNNNGTGPETNNQGALVLKALYDENGNLILEGEKSKIELGFLLTGFINKKY
jgi:hypothetical protein